MVQIGPSKERVSRADVILLVEDAILVQMEPNIHNHLFQQRTYFDVRIFLDLDAQ